MNEENKKLKFKNLLDKLQQESWQLELLISGFAIYGLFNTIEPIEIGWNEAKALQKYTKFLFPILFLSCYILIINLVLHVVLRGLWIGAIGLRYVSNEIEYEELNYSKRFTKYLKKKVGSFDNYIDKLENYCSILFAVTFLSLFYMISFFSVLFIITLMARFFLDSGIFSEFVGAFLLGTIGLLFIFLALIVFFDFLTQGGLKKKEWTSFLYMPIYKVFNYITFAFLYRPIVYNFLDNKFGKRIAFILLPLYAVIFYLTTLKNAQSHYLTNMSYTSKNFVSKNNYLDLLDEHEYVKDVALNTKITDKPYVSIFIPFKEQTENDLLIKNPELKPIENQRGIKSSFKFIFKNRNKDLHKRDSIYKLYLRKLNELYTIKIDSITKKSDFIITAINKQLGFETVIPLKSSEEGKHIINISSLYFDKKSKEEKTKTIANIPFWYYKN